MKKILVFVALAALVATGCQSTNDTSTSSTPNPVVAPPHHTYPPSPNTINNPPATVAPPNPGTAVPPP